MEVFLAWRAPKGENLPCPPTQLPPIFTGQGVLKQVPVMDTTTTPGISVSRDFLLSWNSLLWSPAHCSYLLPLPSLN